MIILAIDYKDIIENLISIYGCINVGDNENE